MFRFADRVDSRILGDSEFVKGIKSELVTKSHSGNEPLKRNRRLSSRRMHIKDLAEKV